MRLCVKFSFAKLVYMLAVTFVAFIRQISTSNLGQRNSYHQWDFLNFVNSFQANSGVASLLAHEHIFPNTCQSLQLIINNHIRIHLFAFQVCFGPLQLLQWTASQVQQLFSCLVLQYPCTIFPVCAFFRQSIPCNGFVYFGKEYSSTELSLILQVSCLLGHRLGYFSPISIQDAPKSS